ncbi:hypothetical protein PSA01_20180 [Pseudonocardia saturnea]|uniref:Uncharacterized protein n=1 Tax=Pseudonocardia saturnea TaxID=33909 RepID=A0ABQ0RWE4_9PSEU|nr:hypothetical protein PSA01_20180 [Pseudonocardia saturnea]
MGAGVGRCIAARLGEAVHVDVDELPQGRDEMSDMDPGAAVDGGGVLTGEEADAHGG